MDLFTTLAKDERVKHAKIEKIREAVNATTAVRNMFEYKGKQWRQCNKMILQYMQLWEDVLKNEI